MKNFFAVGLVVALTLVSSTAFGQFKKGDNLLNLGLGLNSYYNGGIPLSVSLEHGVTNEISVGGIIDYLSYHYGYIGSNYNFNAFFIGARGSYHFNKVLNINDKEWDIYAGLSLGLRSVNWNDNNFKYSNGAYGTGLFLGVHAGARYYFSPKVGGFFELGALGSTNVRLGVAFKF
ncbi:MAG: hypothetical protein JST48_13945 [Bacteroidetes bacterium]|nr:hypothetical protein [Bacteroidota bacterium]